jgi:hypothetical protein
MLGENEVLKRGHCGWSSWAGDGMVCDKATTSYGASEKSGFPNFTLESFEQEGFKLHFKSSHQCLGECRL